MMIRRMFHLNDSKAIRLLVNLMLLAILIEIPFTVYIARSLEKQQQAINSGISNVEKENLCFATFFAKPGPSRASTSIINIKTCQPIVHKVM